MDVVGVYFASDLHLSAVEDPNLDRFYALCDRVAADGRALYLLGDVFEAYVGDDDDAALPAAVAARLKLLTERGIAVYFGHGNRDFLVGPAFLARCGAHALAELQVLDIGPRRCVLLHGDSLCTDDLAYQTARRQLRDPQWQSHFLAQPLAARRAFALQARAQSAAHTAVAAAAIMDVNQDAVAAVFEHSGAHWMIHGHTHRPAVHGKPDQQRIVLGDWPNAASWLRIDAQGQGSLHFNGQSIAL